MTDTHALDLSTIPEALQSALAGKYELQRELGRGGMAVVYLARDPKHDRHVAVKVLRGELANNVGAERFLREIAIAAHLQHPNILTLIDSGEALDTRTGERFVYYVMPYVAGESLRDRLARGGSMPVSEALPLLRDIVDGVASAHRHGVVHRDIKPDNVLLTEQHALVVDFGVAKAMSDARDTARLTATGISLGTPAYMAPEQAAGETVDHRADIYAIGVVAYEMLSGAPPFTGQAQSVISQHLTAAPRPIASRDRGGIPPAVERIVMRCLEKDPAARYQSADELLAALDAISAARPANRKLVIAAGGGALAVIALLAIFGMRARRESVLHARTLPDIQRLVDKGDNDSAFTLAERAAATLPDDSLLAAMWPRFSRRLSFVTVPAGATVYRARFDDTAHWESLGNTPLYGTRVPSTVDRYRIVKSGFRPIMLLTGGIDYVMSPPLPARFNLDPVSAPDSAMVRIPGGEFTGDMPGLVSVPMLRLGDFLIDRHEVTNREYKRFVDAGGYRRREFWDVDEDFVKDGRRLSWAEAVALFVDRTGRPGPATWEAGDIPPGQEDLPVGGVSWYEAAAYARFTGKALPTVYHWTRAAGTNTAAYVTPGSNFDSQGPSRGSTFRGMSPWGTFDMAGNVREWCVNADAEGKRYILGGGWSDSPYMFTDAYAQPPFDRSVINGIRLAKYLRGEPALAAASGPITRRFRDFRKEKPVGDAVFATFRQMYDYDRTPLNARIESRDTASSEWNRENISFDAAYGHERMTLMLYLPKHATPPYQTVVFYPGSNALHTARFDDAAMRAQDFMVKSGRAFAYPIFKSTYERDDHYANDIPDSSVLYRDHVLMWGKDLRRALDYLVTRADVDSTKLAYYGVSWGGRMAGIMLAIEPRFKVAVLQVAGLKMAPSRPEVDPLHFLPRISASVLMLNGKYDHFFPIESSQQPFFNLLGTPPDRKKHLVYEGGHFVPRTELITESLAWLDKYLGPVGHR